MPVSKVQRVVAPICERLPALIIAMGTYVYQCGVMNYYVQHYDQANNKMWGWYIADTMVLIIFLAAFVTSGMKNTKINDKGDQIEVIGHTVPFSYLGWFLYSVFLSTKLTIVMSVVARGLFSNLIWGPNMLKTALALTAILFCSYLIILHDAKEGSQRKKFIDSLTGAIMVDMFDVAAFISVLFKKDSGLKEDDTLQHVIISVSCMNYILPCIPILVLSRTHFGKIPISIEQKTLVLMMYMLLINIPLMVIRLLLWWQYKFDVSVFVIKNVLFIGKTLSGLRGDWKVLEHNVEEAEMKQWMQKKKEIEQESTSVITTSYVSENEVQPTPNQMVAPTFMPGARGQHKASSTPGASTPGAFSVGTPNVEELSSMVIENSRIPVGTSSKATLQHIMGESPQVHVQGVKSEQVPSLKDGFTIGGDRTRFNTSKYTSGQATFGGTSAPQSAFLPIEQKGNPLWSEMERPAEKREALQFDASTTGAPSGEEDENFVLQDKSLAPPSPKKRKKKKRSAMDATSPSAFDDEGSFIELGDLDKRSTSYKKAKKKKKKKRSYDPEQIESQVTMLQED